MGIGKKIEINYPFVTKLSARGFSFQVPELLKPTFRYYLRQFPYKTPGTEQFLKSWSNRKDGKGRVQNIGINTIDGFAGKCAVILNKEGHFTAHSFRRSATTTLAESGISVVGICHAGR